MAESIQKRTHALSDSSDAYELAFLLRAILADLTAIVTGGSSVVTDMSAIRTKLAASIVDVAAMRTPIAASVVDVAAMRTPIAATVTDVAALNARLNTAMISPPGLVIGTVSPKVPKATYAIQAVVGGTLVFKAADTAMCALTAGTVAQNKFAIWAFYMDNAGTITCSSKTADCNTAALAYAALPAIPANKVQIGFIIVTNSASAFVGGTDDLNIASNTVIYVDSVGIQAPAITLTAAAPAALTAAAPAALTASTPDALTTSAFSALTLAT